MSKVKNGLNHIGVNSGGTATQYTTKVVDIGSWDMDTTADLTLAHGLSSTEWQRIIGLQGTVIPDGGTPHYYFTSGNVTSFISGSEYYDLFIWNIGSTNISIHRKTSGTFDNSAYSSTTVNRGWVAITYKPD